MDFLPDSLNKADSVQIVPTIAFLVFSWYLGSCIWYRYLSPISDIPGPFVATFSRLWLIQMLRGGRGARELAELHQKYGQ